MGGWDKFKDKLKDLVEETVEVTTGKTIIDDPRNILNPANPLFQKYAGTNMNPLIGVGGKTDFFEKPWTDRTRDEWKAMLSGEYDFKDYINPGGVIMNPGQQIFDPGNFLDRESIEAYASGKPEGRDVISAGIAGGVAAGVGAFSGLAGAESGAAGYGAAETGPGAGTWITTPAGEMVFVGPTGAATTGTGAVSASGGGMTALEVGTTLGSTLAQVGASYYGAKKSAEAMEEASRLASEKELEMFYVSRADTAPWREAGAASLNILAQKIGEGPGEFDPTTEPGYQFGYEEFVEKPLLRGAAAGGRLGGGRTAKELTRYASDYGTTKYDQFLDRWYKSLTPYQSVAGLGQTSAERGAERAISTGRSVGQNILTSGVTRGSGYQQTAAAVGQAAAGLGQNVLDYYYMQKYK